MKTVTQKTVFRTAGLHSVLLQAEKIATDLGHHWVGTAHVLLAILEDRDRPGSKELNELGVNYESMLEAIGDRF